MGCITASESPLLPGLSGLRPNCGGATLARDGPPVPQPTSMKKRNTAKPLAENKHLLRWVEKMADLCKPDALHWVDGTKDEYDALCAQMVEGGTFTKLNEKLWPDCYYARSDPTDVARVEDRTFICSNSREGAGPTNNWVNP